MYHETPPPVVRKRISFPSVLVLSFTGVILTTVVCATGVVLYGMRIADHKADTAMDFVRGLASQVPDVVAGLPPVLAEALNDERRPDYRDQIHVTARLVSNEGRRGSDRVAVEVENTGEEVISLMSLRVVGLDEEGQPVDERHAWPATPLQLDDDEWRGPILPGEKRRFVVSWWSRERVAAVETEVTEIRIWRGPTSTTVAAPAPTDQSIEDSTSL